MQLTVTPAAQERLAKYLQKNPKLVLDYDAGVGPFSDLGNCSLDANYKLVFVDPTPRFPDFDAHFGSSIVVFYCIGYPKPQHDEEMRLDFLSTFLTIPRMSSRWTLTGNIEVVDLADHACNIQAVQTHDC